MLSQFPSDKKEILLLVSEGDERAFRQLYEQYRTKIYSYAFRLTENSDRAAEVVQEVFLKLWMNREKLGAVSNFDGWLFRIAKNIFWMPVLTSQNGNLRDVL